MLQYVDGDLGSVNLTARTSTQTWIPLLPCVAFEVVSLLRTHDDHVHPICFNCTIRKDMVQDKNQNPKPDQMPGSLLVFRFISCSLNQWLVFCSAPKNLSLYCTSICVRKFPWTWQSQSGSRQRHGSRRSAQLGIRNLAVAPVNSSWFSYWNVHV